MDYSKQEYTGDGAKRAFTFNFVGLDAGYISKDDLYVYVDGVEQPFTLTSSNTFELATAPAVGAKVLIRRKQSAEAPYADFQGGSAFDKVTMNRSFLHLLYIVHQLLDGYFPGGFTFQDTVHFLKHVTFHDGISMSGTAITDLLPGAEEMDAVTMGQLEAAIARIKAIEDGLYLSNITNRCIDRTLIAQGGEDRWVPGFVFTNHLVWIDGVLEPPTTPTPRVTVENSEFFFDPPLVQGEEVYALLGSFVAAPDDFLTGAQVRDSLVPYIKGTKVLDEGQTLVDLSTFTPEFGTRLPDPLSLFTRLAWNNQMPPLAITDYTVRQDGMIELASPATGTEAQRTLVAVQYYAGSGSLVGRDLGQSKVGDMTLTELRAALDQLSQDAALRANNLSDLTLPATARSNLGLGSAATQADGRYAHRSNNLSDLTSAATARNNLGLGTAATKDADEITPESVPAGSVGSFVYARGPEGSYGGTAPGSELSPAGVGERAETYNAGDGTTETRYVDGELYSEGVTLSGTWRRLGYAVTVGGYRKTATLWLRIT